MRILNRRRQTTIALALLGWTLLLTALTAFIGVMVEKAYLQNHSFFYDPVSYQRYNAILYMRLRDESRLTLALQEWLHNYRHPLRTVPLLLFAPGLLAAPMGHLATALPAFLVFLWLLGWTVYRRTSSIMYALVCMALFSALPGLVNPVTGLAVYWLDNAGALYAGGAVLCLLNSAGARDSKWLVGFGILAAFTALSRYIAVTYLGIACGPILAYYLVTRWRQEGQRLQSILAPLVLLGTPIGVLAGYFLIAHFRENLYYYTTFQYDKSSGMLASAGFLLQSAQAFLSRRLALLLGVLCLANLALFWRNGKRDWQELLVSFWCPGATLFFLVFVLQPSTAYQVVPYLVAFFFPAVVSPASVPLPQFLHRRSVPLGAVLLVAALFLGGRGAWKSYDLASQPSNQDQEQKTFEIMLAQALVKEGRTLVWNSFFDQVHDIPTMEAFYRFGVLAIPGDKPFTIHETWWRARYPNQSPESVAKVFYADTTKRTDIAVVLDDPARADALFDNIYSRAVSRYMAMQIPRESRWRRAFVLTSRRYGTVSGYRNLTATGRLYSEILRRPSFFFGEL